MLLVTSAVQTVLSISQNGIFIKSNECVDFVKLSVGLILVSIKLASGLDIANHINSCLISGTTAGN